MNILKWLDIVAVELFSTIQSARDIVGTGTQEESSIIYDNISTQIFLPNIAAKANDRVNEQYRSLGLSDLETQIITKCIT